MIRTLGCLISFGFSCLLFAQEQGAVRPAGCDSDCKPDRLEIVFDNGDSIYDGSLEVGALVPVDVVFQADQAGVQGWSVSVAHDNEQLALDAATIDGTIADPDFPGALVCAPYAENTQIVEGGFFSAVVLAFLKNVELPIDRMTLCRAEYRIVAPVSCSVIEFVSDEFEERPGVTTEFTRRGRSVVPGVFRQGILRAGEDCHEICGDCIDNDGDGFVDCDDDECEGRWICRGQRPFSRGDVNSDGEHDIGDAVKMLRVAFFASFPGNCEAALDANGDGCFNLSDPVTLLRWMFLAGDPLPSPFLECGFGGECRVSNCR